MCQGLWMEKLSGCNRQHNIHPLSCNGGRHCWGQDVFYCGRQYTRPVWGHSGAITVSQTLPDMLFEPAEQGLCCRLGSLNTNSLSHPTIWRLLLWGRKWEARGQHPNWAWEREQYPDNLGHQWDAAVRPWQSVWFPKANRRQVLGFSKKKTYWVSGFDTRAREGFAGFSWPHPLSLSLSFLYNIYECQRETGKERIVLPRIIVKMLTDQFILSWDISWKK